MSNTTCPKCGAPSDACCTVAIRERDEAVADAMERDKYAEEAAYWKNAYEHNRGEAERIVEWLEGWADGFDPGDSRLAVMAAARRIKRGEWRTDKDDA